jgi:rhodanese-related sulfurtransferase
LALAVFAVPVFAECSQEQAAPVVDRYDEMAESTVKNTNTDLCPQLSSAGLSNWLQRHPAGLIIDTRLPAEYAKSHVIGSLNVESHLLQTRTFFRDKPVLLLGRLDQYGELLSRCAKLIAADFSQVAVFQGDIYNWPDHAQMTGADLWSAPVATITARELQQSQSRFHWHRVDLSQNQAAVESGIADVASSFDKLDAYLRQCQVNASSQNSVRVVLIDENGDLERQLGHHSKLPPNMDIRYLQGGIREFQNYRNSSREWSSGQAKANPNHLPCTRAR